MFFEQAGSSFTFLADKIVNREFGGWTFPIAWFQSVNSIAIIVLAPVMAWIWVKLGRAGIRRFRASSASACSSTAWPSCC